ncbi:MAG: hypothetical protein UT48_C0005G0023 [Parcubacteria group bacterium GW2011_GWE2_39_37]|nr:MAG: hypothetical protein UT48_C0005G0023 [Parcubacteria group bacterium GW2011_GWE2_39_37]
MQRGKKIENKKNNEVKKTKRTEINVKVAAVNSKKPIKKEPVKKNQPAESKKKDSSIKKHMIKKDYVEESINQEQEELEMEKLPEDVKGWVISEEAVEKKRAMDYVKIDHDKKIIMWSGVTFFMILIFGFWLFNISLVFKRQPISEAKSQLNIEDITENFNKTMEEINKNLNEYDGLKTASSSEIAPSTNTAPSTVLPDTANSSTSSEPVVTSEEINQLKMQLKELENRLGSSSNKNMLPVN